MSGIVYSTELNTKIKKISIGIFIVGIGSYFLAQGLINYVGYQQCIDRRAQFEGMENVPLSISFECNNKFTDLFIIASIVKAIGIVILVLAMLDVSMWSLRREKTL
jgi:uncharacterized membrane protein YidH (DUF202 family)